MRSVLNDYRQAPFQHAPLPLPPRLFKSANVALANRLPNYADSIWTPVSTTGSTTNVYLFDVHRQPAVSVGGKNGTNSVYVLGTNQVARFGHPLILSMSIVTQSDSACTYRIKIASTSIQTNTLAGGGAGTPMLVDALTLAQTEAIFGTYGLYAIERPNLAENWGFEIECLTGTLKLLGVVVFTWERREIPFENMRFSGTWSSELGVYSAFRHWYSDTLGDSVTIPFYGSGVQVLLAARSASSTVDAKIDGATFKSNYDLYKTGNYIWPANMFPNYSAAWNQNTRGGLTPHWAHIRSNGTNGSVIAPTGTNHRLVVLQASDLYTD
jgi:hypothetical protein